MKVWSVSYLDSGELIELRVFSTKEKANSYANKIIKLGYDNPVIDEHKLDDMQTVEEKEALKGRCPYCGIKYPTNKLSKILMTKRYKNNEETITCSKCGGLVIMERSKNEQ